MEFRESMVETGLQDSWDYVLSQWQSGCKRRGLKAGIFKGVLPWMARNNEQIAQVKDRPFSTEVRCLKCDYSPWSAHLEIYNQISLWGLLCIETLFFHTPDSKIPMDFNSLWKWVLFYIIFICILSLKRKRISLIRKLVFYLVFFLIHGLVQTIKSCLVVLIEFISLRENI